MFSNAHAQSAGEQADAGLADIRPLKIGDSIPEELWQMPLQVVNHPEGKETITLNDYRGKKLIILDFWSTWCGACIAKMPRLEKLNKIFEKDIIIIPVNKQAKSRVVEFSKKNHVLDSLKPFSVTDAQALGTLFPHTMVPHEIWITDNVFKAATSAEYVNEHYINQLLHDGYLDAKHKEDVLDFDSDKPFLVNGNGGHDTSFLYRSIFTAYKHGLPSRTSTSIQKDNSYWKISATNIDIRTLYSLAFSLLNRLPEERIIIRIPPERLSIHGFDGLTTEEWNTKNLYCYELNLPQVPLEQLSEIIGQDLDRYLGLSGRIELRSGLEYFILEPRNAGNNL